MSVFGCALNIWDFFLFLQRNMLSPILHTMLTLGYITCFPTFGRDINTSNSSNILQIPKEEIKNESRHCQKQPEEVGTVADSSTYVQYWWPLREMERVLTDFLFNRYIDLYMKFTDCFLSAPIYKMRYKTNDTLC